MSNMTTTDTNSTVSSNDKDKDKSTQTADNVINFEDWKRENAVKELQEIHGDIPLEEFIFGYDFVNEDEEDLDALGFHVEDTDAQGSTEPSDLLQWVSFLSDNGLISLQDCIIIAPTKEERSSTDLDEFEELMFFTTTYDKQKVLDCLTTVYQNIEDNNGVI